jgi:hypothetical protein
MTATTSTLPVTCGHDASGQPAIIDLAVPAPHVLITGGFGCGLTTRRHHRRPGRAQRQHRQRMPPPHGRWHLDQWRAWYCAPRPDQRRRRRAAAHLIGEITELPDDPGVFGWHTPPGAAPKADGLCFGVAASRRRVYLIPAAACTAAKRAAASRGIRMPVTPGEIGAILAAWHLIILDPADGGPAWRRIRNVTSRIWDMPADTIQSAAATAAEPALPTPPPGGKGH